MSDSNNINREGESLYSVSQLVEQDSAAEAVLPDGCRLIELPNVSDERGELCFVESMNHVPFEVKRVFWTYNVKSEARRGNHAHRVCSMVLFPVGGALTINLDDGRRYVELRLDKSNVGVLIPPFVWSCQYDYEPHAACVCLASHPYSPEDYIYNKEEMRLR